MTSKPVAVVTGASLGLGRALTLALVDRGWHVVVDGRNPAPLAELTSVAPSVVAINGDVADPAHRDTVAAAVGAVDRLDLLVNNASALGPSPLPTLERYPLEALRSVFETNVVAPLAMVQLLLPYLRASRGTVVNVSSDAAVEGYAGWGGYGASKAASDQLTNVLGAEESDVRVYAVDPGDMRTAMHQRAFPGEDISDRPLPEQVVPGLLRLVDARPTSGRYRASQWLPVGQEAR